MNIPVRSLNSGFSMPGLGKGTWMAGTKKKTYQDTDEALRIQSLIKTIDNGGIYIDTAARYGAGYSEELVGKAIKGKVRENLFITSKLSSSHISKEEILLATKRSLNRLNIEYLDLYLIHQFDSRISLPILMDALDFLIEQKLVRNIGVCNFTIDQYKQAQSHTKNKIVVNQLKYSFLSRVTEVQKIVQFCQENDVLVIAWKPFPQHLLTTKGNALLQNLASKYDKTAAQIAYAWLIQQENMVVLADINTEEDMQSLKDAFAITFTPDEIKDLHRGQLVDESTHGRRKSHDK